MTNESLETILLLFLLFYVVATFGVPIWLAVKKNQALLETGQKVTPYKWGYFWGYFSIFSAPLFIFLLWFDTEMKSFDLSLAPNMTDFFVEALYSFALVVIGIGILKRTQLAWIATVAMGALSFALLLNWIGLALAAWNGYYAWGRRAELAFFTLTPEK